MCTSVLAFFLELTTQNLEPWTRNLEPWTLNLEPWIFRRLLLSGWTINAHFYADLFLIRLKTQNRPNGELENNTLNRWHLDSPHCPPLPWWSHGTNSPNRHLVVLHILAVTVQLDGFLTWFLFSQNVIVRTRLCSFYHLTLFYCIHYSPPWADLILLSCRLPGVTELKNISYRGWFSMKDYFKIQTSRLDIVSAG